MRTLNRLLIAELSRMWGQSLAICVVLACGVATFTMSSSTIKSLELTCARYYREYRFANVFVSVKRAPNRLAHRFREIPDVDRVETRVVRDVILDMPGMPEPATCRLISIPDTDWPGLNAVHLRRGRVPNPDRRGEVLASEMFAEAHQLRLNDSIKVIMGGREQELHVVGVGMSPEYIYAVQPGQMLPDNRHFGVLWMPYRQMAAAFNMEGAFNSASLLLRPRASIPNVIEQLDLLTESYGGLGAATRDEQISHRRVTDEIHQLAGMARVSPTVFLVVAAFLFNLVFSRVVYRRREEIATLRAFGYRPLEIGLHFMKMLLVLVVIGFSSGTCGGIFLAHRMVDLYGNFFRFPVLYYEIAWDGVLFAAGLSLLVGCLGAFAAIRRAMRLPPAVAMRPDAPQAFGKSLVERLGLGQFLSSIAIMVFRRMERNWKATWSSVAGMALGTSLLVLGSFMEDTINYVIDVQFQRAQRQDVMVAFHEARSSRAAHDVYQLPGVQEAEMFRSAVARLAYGRRSRRVSLFGLEHEPQLFRVLDQQVQPVAIHPGGLTISQKLSEILGAGLGDEIQVDVLEGRRPRLSVPIVAVFPDYAEPGAYMNRHELNRLLREGESVSGAFLKVNSSQLDDFHARLKQTPTAAGVTVKKAVLQSFEDTIAENLRPLRLMNAMFASVIAFGVIYNCALTTLAERSRDLATLRVLGFTRGEVSRLLLGELAVVTLAALPLGLPIGFALSYAATLALDTETHRFPLVVSRATFAYATVVMLAAATVSALIVRKMIDRLDLIEVLKVKE